MKKTILVVSIVLLFGLLKVNVNALDPACTQAEQLRLRQLANATKISYEFYEDNIRQIYGFNVIISGFSPDFYIYNINKGISFEYTDNSTITKSGYSDGTTYELPFLASENGPCKGLKILTKTVVLPNYNPYSKNSLCVGYETYELCKKFTSLTIGSVSEFEERMIKYINSLKEKKTEDKKEPEDKKEISVWEKISNFIGDYYMILLIIIIISSTTGIVAIEIKQRRSIL